MLFSYTMQNKEWSGSDDVRRHLLLYADKYESADFINGDPSWFMHQVEGSLNQETMAWIAQSLSYGKREQFMTKLELILHNTHGEVYDWVAKGEYKQLFMPDDTSCFYRLYTKADMYRFFYAYQSLLHEFGSLYDFVKSQIAAESTALNAVKALCVYFSQYDCKIIPNDATSSCKRICMFLRWMVRDNSPVDLGLWRGLINRRTLIMPLDAHVLTQAKDLGLLSTKAATMSAAIRLTEKLRSCFPDDPVKADFALFGYGVNHVK